MNPQVAVNGLPPIVVSSLINAMQSAYAAVDSFCSSFPLLSIGPHSESVRGYNRWAAIEQGIFKAYEDGSLPGKAVWVPIDGSHQVYLEYQWDDYSITFSHVDLPMTLPRKSVYRDNRAFDNEQWLFKEYDQPALSTINLLMTHGDKNLEFAHIALTRVIDGKLVALAWSPNLAFDAGEGFGGITAPTPVEPVAPVAREYIKPIALHARAEFAEIEQQAKKIE